MGEAAVRFGDVPLEGFLALPRGGGAVPGAVVCHPHPLYGGDMHNNVVRGLARCLGRAGFAVLRFNFRGVGASGGSHSGGEGEVADVAEALDFLACTSGVESSRLAVVGYSFGAAVGWAAGAAIPGAVALVAVAPPLALYPMLEAGASPKPKLAAAGTGDGFCPPREFERWFEGLSAPKEAVGLEGADHFLAGREEEVGEIAAGFLCRTLSRPAAAPS